MKTFFRPLWLFPILGLLALPRAEAAQDAGLPGAYLNSAGSVRALGMERAVVAIADGVDAIAWNPAGLGYLRPNVVDLTHTQTGESATMEFLGYAQPIYRWGAAGVDYLRFDSGSLPQTNQFNQQVGTFNDVEQTVMAGYGYAPLRWLSVGGTFKFSQQSLAGTSASGWGMDVGAMGKMDHGLSWGLRIQNLLTPSLQYGSGTDQFPRLLTVGAAARILDNRLTLTSDFDKTLDAPGPLDWRMGVETILLNVIALRGGFDIVNKEFSLGFSYRYGGAQVGYVNSMNQLDSNQNIGLDYAFGGYDVTAHATSDSFSPIGLKKSVLIAIQVNHSKKIYSWLFEIKDQNRNLVRTMRGSGNPPAELEWDGMNEEGNTVPAGSYTYTMSLTDADGRVETTPAQVIRLYYGTPQDAIEIQAR